MHDEREPDLHTSLLDEATSSIGVGTRRPSPRERLRAFERNATGALAGAWARPASRYAIMGVTSLGAIAIGLGIYIAIRPVPKPDYEQADMARMFDYTLLTEEFNNLPVEERIELISQLYGRVRSMDAAESAMMASFFAGVAGEARDQLEKNATKLFIDAADMVAMDYTGVRPEEKEAYLEQSLVRLIRLAEPFDPGITGATDEEILEEARGNAERDRQALEEGEMTAQQASRMMVFMGQRVDKNASAHQRQRINLFMRDLGRHLRGQRPGG